MIMNTQKNIDIPEYLLETYIRFEKQIIERLQEFERLKDLKNINKDKYFYEFCFCILTPQSSAKKAMLVQNELEKRDFYKNKFNPVDILNNREHYIRFHNVKSERLLKAIDFYDELYKILGEDISVIEKRKKISENFKGVSFKESSHFLRNIGYKNLAIIDRHIMKHLQICNVIDTKILPNTEKNYLFIERKFLEFCLRINISIDVMDFVFFAYDTGEVLK